MAMAYAKLVIENEGGIRPWGLWLKTDLYDEDLEEIFLTSFAGRPEALDAANALAERCGGIAVEVEG